METKLQKTEIMKLETPELEVIEKSKAEQIRATFEPMVKMLSQFEDAYNTIIAESEKEITKDVTAKAKRLRIDIGRVRIETEKLRIAQKEEYLRAGKAIDGLSNILKWAITDKENKLKDVENYFEIQEQKRLDALQAERVDLLSKYVEDASERSLSNMDEDVWNAYLSTKEKEYNDRIEAEKKAEADRIAREKAEAAERERIRKENEQLKKEAVERERLTKIEAEKRAKEEAARKAREEKERAEYEAKLKYEREERERVEREERQKREKAEAELKAKIEAENKAEFERIANEKAALMAPDKDQLMRLLNVSLPEINVKSPESIQLEKEIRRKFDSFKIWVTTLIEKL